MTRSNFSTKATTIAAVIALAFSSQAALADDLVIVNKQPLPNLNHPPKVALALGGGGTRGGAHVTILRALEKNGIPIDIICGTSIGAIVGGLYSAGIPTEELEREFQSNKLMKAFMTVPLWVRLAASPIMVMPRVFGFRPYDGLYFGNKFRKYLHSYLPKSEQNIEDLKIPFAAVAVDIVDGKPYSLRKGNLPYALQASSAVPGLRKPVQIGDQLFVDGGFMDNLPVAEARDMGADIVIAVDVDERVDKVPLDTFRKIGSVSERMLKLQLANEDKHQVRLADIVIHPNVDGIGLVSTRLKDGRKAMQAGEAAAIVAIPIIKAKLAEAGIALRPADEKVSSRTRSIAENKK